MPTELLEPALGINFACYRMNRNDWLALIAVHSDSWLPDCEEVERSVRARARDEDASRDGEGGEPEAARVARDTCSARRSWTPTLARPAASLCHAAPPRTASRRWVKVN